MERFKDAEPKRPFEELTLKELCDRITEIGYNDFDVATNKLFTSLMDELELRNGTLSDN